MRVVGGVARGRKFAAPPGLSTRPTSDRVREAIFGILGSLPDTVDVCIEDATVADLFAGSGAFGIEALSRGAAHATFVDIDREAVATIGDNLADLRLAGSRASVKRGDALRWLETAEPTDLVLCDPPYAFDHDQWVRLAALLVPVAAVAVLETGAPLVLGPGWEVLREKRYGGTVIVVARPAPSPDTFRDRKGGT